MDIFKVDYSEKTHFKGIRILYDFLEEGLKYAQNNNINEVCIWTNGNWNKKIVDFTLFENMNFIETLHWLVPLSKKSDIKGLYHLSRLKDFRFENSGNFNIDLTNFKLLEKLNIGYGTNIQGWNSLDSLSDLVLSSVKTENLFFLKEVRNLFYLRIVEGTFSSIEGIEQCSQLNTIFFQKCRKLTALNKTLKNLKNVKKLIIEGSKKVDIHKELKDIKIEHISVM